MLCSHCALQACKVAHKQSASSERAASKTRVGPIFCPWLIKYDGKSGFSLSNSVIYLYVHIIWILSRAYHNCEYSSANPSWETMRNKRHKFNPVVYQMGVLSTYTMYILIINSETKIMPPAAHVAEFGLMFPDVAFAILFRWR